MTQLLAPASSYQNDKRGIQSRASVLSASTTCAAAGAAEGMGHHNPPTDPEPPSPFAPPCQDSTIDAAPTAGFLQTSGTSGPRPPARGATTVGHRARARENTGHKSGHPFPQLKPACLAQRPRSGGEAAAILAALSAFEPVVACHHWSLKSGKASKF